MYVKSSEIGNFSSIQSIKKANTSSIQSNPALSEETKLQGLTAKTDENILQTDNFISSLKQNNTKSNQNAAVKVANKFLPGTNHNIANNQGVNKTEEKPENDNNDPNIEKTRNIMQKVKDNIGKVDVYVKNDKLVIDKPFFMKDDVIPIDKSKSKEAPDIVNGLVKKFKEGKDPTMDDARNLYSLLDKESLAELIKKNS